MRIRPAVLPILAAGLLSLAARPALAGTVSSCTSAALAISCTGALDTPEDVFLDTFTLPVTESLTIQTYGFGGGTNAAGATIAAGGFDSLVALFSGPATNATVLTDAFSNPVASADSLSLFSPGCPPAGLVTVGSVPGNCGDNQINTASLGPGTYTLALTDADFLPLAVDPQIPGAYDLTDTTSGNYGSSNGAYIDLSGGVFQTCVTQTDCNTPNGNFAVDITGSSVAPQSTPEPATAGLAGLAFAAFVALIQFRKKEKKSAGC
jgi:hypothetical protein